MSTSLRLPSGSALVLGLSALAAPAMADSITMQPLQVQDSAANGFTDGYQAKRTTTATKTDTPLRDVPQSVSVVTREVMEDQGVRSMADAVRYVPGVTAAQGEGNRDQLVIRGTNSTADFFSNGMRDDSQVFRDVYNVDRVEVLKGPNAMIFGRGGGGGVVNRVMKSADGSPVRQVTVQGGMFNTKRASMDVGDSVTPNLAFRVNGLVEESDSYRDEVHLQRQGFNPTLTATRDDTKVTLSYEFFNDDRTADRGVPSVGGRPLATDSATFFGNPDLSYSESKQHTGGLAIEHRFSDAVTLKNQTRIQATDKFYQNVFAGAVTGTNVSLSAYNSATQRENVFNQTDLVTKFGTGPVKHTLLTGIELGRQATDSFRNTGYFSNGLENQSVSIFSPTTYLPVTFRQKASDGNTSTIVTTAAAYVQDQVALSEQWELIGGLRYDRFGMDYTNNRNGQTLERTDNLLSPRLGVVFKPVQPVSLYTSYSVSHLPSSGDQFSSMSVTQSTLRPEKFTNMEVGAKWEVNPDLSLTTAVYQLNRENNIATMPGTTTSVQMGEQRTRGFELGASGKITDAWQVAGGYAYQNATYVERTAAVAEGNSIAMVPRHMVSLWNKYQFDKTWAAGLGAIYQGAMPTSADNNVTLPAFTRFDAAVYANISETLRAQLNVQNLLDRDHYATAHSNNNITPGAPRTVMLTLTSDF